MNDALQFLELSLPAADIRKSLGWYGGLGMAEFPTNDVRQHHYAVVGTDDLAIGLHADMLTAPALTFVQQNLARHVRNRMEQGEEFVSAELGIDDFHEATQADPDGLLAMLVEARTFSPGHTHDTPALGRLASVMLPCMHMGESLAFWQRYGFIAVAAEDGRSAELHAPGVTVALHAGNRELTLCFRPADYDATVAALNNTYELKMLSTGSVKGVELTAPEGTRIRLMRD